LALPTIPPGSILAICAISEMERQQPNPEHFYFLQHRSGYSCCRCVVDKRRLLFITRGEKVGAQLDFAYPDEVRIVGKVISFAARLPVPNPQPVDPSIARSDTPLILPWEHSSFASLLATERRRFGITEAQIAAIAPLLAAQLGYGLSPRSLRRYEHNRERSPRTATLLAMTVILSLRVSDVFRALGMRSSERQMFSLSTLMENETTTGRLLSIDPPPSPDPQAQWQELIDKWRGWPTLLSMTHPNLSAESDNLLRFNPGGGFKGLNPLIPDGSVIAVDPLDLSPPKNGDIEKEGWNRPIFALRHRGEILCGYLESNETHFAIQPHPRAGVPRLLFRRSRIQVLGRVTAVASPLWTKS
jgi:hypothetical protein